MNKLYKVWQSVNTGYDTYDSLVCSAKNEEEARNIKPSEYMKPNDFDAWAKPDQLKVELIGTTKLPSGLILASFNAG